MSLVKISQRTAILLEHARKSGLTSDELLEAVRSEDLAQLAAAEAEHFHYDEWIPYAKEHGEDLEKAITDGYQITFNTRNGLKMWLEESFGISSETDFTVGEGVIEGLHLQENQLTRLKTALAVNWLLDEEAAPGGFKVKLTVRGLQ
ncbi:MULTISPECIES: hypothetical protein [Paenibacillus]|uniref:Uncharacterized protein n=1 Tax=Paenibacillus campinasensis TaxID=66347 RepID=A0A268EKT4_9BACL|nr:MULTISPECIES: hypothetical protein [Paenibacillus]PAD73714.1 hypothetical protein CHH67_19360 [Paenibacillus campinasensis]PAK48902.1 hypothetical protein CHH75_21725 [Paenibacillus sp. 7541]